MEPIVQNPPGTVEPVGKAWGQAFTPLVDPNHVEVMFASITADGFSSIHHHNDKHNQFFVISGNLDVWTYCLDPQGKPKPIGVSRLVAGQFVMIPAGVIHQFIAMTDVTLVETYTPARPGAQVRPEDIVRLT